MFALQSFMPSQEWAHARKFMHGVHTVPPTSYHVRPTDNKSKDGIFGHPILIVVPELKKDFGYRYFSVARLL